MCDSRAKAQGLILAGQVMGPHGCLDKPGRLVPDDLVLTLKERPPFVSRGGEKLQGFLMASAWSVAGLQALDIGASTGGFTDCLLQSGAAGVTCVDVGYGQLHASLRDDPRVTLRERLNARYITQEDLPLSAYDFLVMDVSFISVTKVLPVVWPFLKPGARAVILIKPQFEADKHAVNKGKGVISDVGLRQKIVESIQEFCQTTLLGCHCDRVVPSPILGPKGNQEFLMGLRRGYH